VDPAAGGKAQAASLMKRVTPAMAAGVTDRLCEISEIVGLL